MKNRILHISLAVIMILTSAGCASGIRISADLKEKPKVEANGHVREPSHQFSEYYYQRKSLFEALPRDSGAIVFIGDSITDGCEWNALFQNPQIKNRGISGDISEGVLLRLDEIIESKPSKVFIMIGINDIAQGIPVGAIMGNTERIINRFLAGCPSAKIYVQSVLPVSQEVDKERPIRSVRELNDRLRQLCDREGTTYIDLFSSFVNGEGYLDDKYSNDGLHLMGVGYLKWKEIIEPYVR